MAIQRATGGAPVIPGLLRFARNDGGSETLANSPKRSAELSARFWRETVGLADRRRADLTRKSIEPDAKCGVRTKRLADLDGWAVADNLASVGSRCLIADPGRLDAVEAWIENRPQRESLA